jgi:hypothetical protein
MRATSIGAFFRYSDACLLRLVLSDRQRAELRLYLLVYHGVGGFPWFCAVSLLGFLETVLEARWLSRLLEG